MKHFSRNIYDKHALTSQSTILNDHLDQHFLKGRMHWHVHIKLPVISAVDEGYLTSSFKLFSRLSVNYREPAACTDGHPNSQRSTQERINASTPKLILGDLQSGTSPCGKQEMCQ